MAENSRPYELVLLGATGYTGKLTAEWITTNLPQDLKWAIAGRNAKKLQSVADELKELNPNRPQPDIETCELQKDQLSRLTTKTRLLINTIGPFMHFGEPVVAACAENGTHYLDCTGEVPWYYDMIAKYHTLARKNGAIIIPQCGVDSVPADIMAFSLTTHIRKTLHAGTLNVIMSLYDLKSGLSGGTSLTTLDLFEKYPLREMAKRLHPYSISPVKPNSPSKAPRGSLFYRLLGLQSIPELGGIQTTHVMASVDTCIVHRSWGLYESTATSRPSLSYGPYFRFTEYMRAKSLLFGVLFKLGVGLFGLLLALPPTRLLLSPLVRRFVISKAGEGPAKESMKKDFMSYRAVGIADTERKEKVMGRLDVAHGGYATTALTLSAAADVILRGDVGKTEAGRLGGGILTPATLGEEYVGKLNEFGMKIQVGQ
ncbi:saccharopine dehydrogenase [Trematosphaeria pertusa]|uniref:Saccharopine dehydrogenase n=1 Tax=Trematosphaeria pertusa TaxID=390896 RepID=A0A6A6IC51_9PLEO|nr:saccharopine dehydrogenase [Trematosphaeria pertusa]KAF2248154.1 saccharopine dehydrogenase [Trematosphaeria pertusa]